MCLSPQLPWQREFKRRLLVVDSMAKHFQNGRATFNPIQEQFFSVTAPLRCNKKGGGVLFFVLVESTHMTQHASLPLSHLLLAWFSPVVYPTSPR